MQRFNAWAVIGLLLCAGDAAWAGNAALAENTTSIGHTASGMKAPTRQSGVSSKTADHRQLSDCMSKRMAASRTISYYEAEKVCKDQMGSQHPALSAGNAVPSATAAEH